MKKIISILSLVLLAAPNFALAEDAGGGHGLIAIGSGLAIGLGALGGALGQGKLVASGLEGISRNPGAGDKVFRSLILGLVFVEAIVIISFVIAFFLLGKV